MRFWISGPRLGWFRPGVSFGRSDFRRAAEPPPAAGDFVYVVSGDHGLVKIGISNSPLARLATLQTASPYRLRLAFSAPACGNAFEVEQAAHAILSAHRASGEWFAVSPDMAIAALFAAADQTGCSLSALPQAPAERGGRWRALPTIAKVVVLAAVYAAADQVLPADWQFGFMVGWFALGALILGSS